MSKTAQLKKKAAEFEQKRQYDRALETYVQALESLSGTPDETDIAVYNRVGDIYFRSGALAKALEYYERAVDLYVEAGFFSNATAICRKALRHAPSRSSIYYKLGRISARTGFASDARQNFLEYADHMRKAGNVDEAFRALKEFADLCPGQDDVRLMLAEQLTRAGRNAEALDQLHIVYDAMMAEDRTTEAAATLARMRALDPSVQPRSPETPRQAKAEGLVFIDVHDETPSVIAPLEGLEATSLAPDDEPEGGRDDYRAYTESDVGVSLDAVSGDYGASYAAEPEPRRDDLPGAEWSEELLEPDPTGLDAAGNDVVLEYPADDDIARSEPPAEPEAGADADADAEIGAEAETEAETGAEAETEAETGAVAETDVAPDPETDPETDAAPDPETDAGLAPIPPAAPSQRGDDAFIDLADWLLEDQPAKNTRMVADEDVPPEGTAQIDFTEMLETFKRGVDANVEDGDSDSHYDLGVAFREMGLVDEAITQFQKALRDTSNRVRAYEALGQCFIDRSQFDVARTLLSRAIRAPNMDDEPLVGILYLLGYACEALNRWPDAVTFYQRVFAVDINFRDVSARLARATSEVGAD